MRRAPSHPESHVDVPLPHPPTPRMLDLHPNRGTTYPLALQEPGLARLEEEDCYLAEVEVDEVLRLVCDIGTEVSTHDAVPCGVVLFIELLFDVGSDVLLDVVLVEAMHRT